MPGWGTAVGWIFDRFPNKKESIRNKIQKIEKEMDAITKKKATSSSVKRYERLSNKLSQLNRKAVNS